jgi:hypothetical protein
MRSAESGVGVQLAVLAAMKSVQHLNYLLATALAVEAAVIHNFLWHERAYVGGSRRQEFGPACKVQLNHRGIFDPGQSGGNEAPHGRVGPALSGGKCDRHLSVLDGEFSGE